MRTRLSGFAPGKASWRSTPTVGIPALVGSSRARRRSTIANSGRSGSFTLASTTRSICVVTAWYLTSRSVFAPPPAFSPSALVANAMCASMSSLGLFDRCETTTSRPLPRVTSTASSVSYSEPIWLALTSTELIRPLEAAISMVRSLVVTRSSPITNTRSPSLSRSLCQPS